jgi:hypothetical protein
LGERLLTAVGSGKPPAAGALAEFAQAVLDLPILTGTQATHAARIVSGSPHALASAIELAGLLREPLKPRATVPIATQPTIRRDRRRRVTRTSE